MRPKELCLQPKKYNKPDPVNLGSGTEISIKNLSQMICQLIVYKGEIIWNTTKPDGQPRCMLDISQAKKKFGFKAKTSFKEGLKKNYSMV